MARATSDSLMDQVFAAVTLPDVGQTTIVNSHHEESHTVVYSESHHQESHHEHLEFTTSGVTVGNAVGHGVDRRPTVDTEDQRSEVSALSKATSVSVHSSVSQKSAQHYDLPPIPQYDMPPVVVGDVVVGKAASVASSKSGSHRSAASNHSHHSHHSIHTHDSESTITEGTLVNEPIVVGGVVGSSLTTPVAVGQSFEHDAVIEQFKNLHGKEPSVVSSIVPSSVHLHSESEDSIAPSKLTHSIAVGGVVGSQNELNVLRKSHDIEYTDFNAPAYYQPPSVQDAIDARSEDSFGFEKVEYVEVREHSHEPEHVPQVVHEHVIEQQTYEPYQIVHENHSVPSVDFEEERYSSHEHHHHDHEHHHDSHVTHTFTTNVKQSRSNSASTYQSRHMLAHTAGPKITEELRPAAVLEEDETHVEPPIMAYVAPIPVKPPRTHEESAFYNAYEKEIHHHTEVVKSTTVVQEDIRFGSEGVSALRAKFEHGAPPPLAPVLDMKKYEHQEHHQHHHHHEDTVVEHVQVGEHSYSSPSVENHYDVPFESREKSSSFSSSSSSTSSSSFSSSPQQADQHVYDTPTNDNFSHSPAFFSDDQHHHYVPQIKVITEYRHIDPRHHYVETRVKKTDGHEIVHSPQVQSIDYFKEIERAHHYVPSTPTSPVKDVRLPFHHHNYVPNSLDAKRESRSVERTHHYLPEHPQRVNDQRSVIREHQYLPLEQRSKSVDSKSTAHHEHHYVPLVKKTVEEHPSVVRQHNYVPLEMKQEDNKSAIRREHKFVPLSQKRTEESAHVSREHHFIPLQTENVQKTEQVQWHNQYIPLTPKPDGKKFDAGRSHSYIPLGGNIEKTKTEILREHHFVPLVEKKDAPQTVTAINQPHNYLPAHSTVAVSDKVVIGRDHSFVPLANKVEETPRHSNDLVHHHYMPLPVKNQERTVKGDKVGMQHHYHPLPPKTEKQVAQSGQEHHYVPLIAKLSVEQDSNVDRHHQFVPLANNSKVANADKDTISRDHSFVPLAANKTGEAQRHSNDLSHHHYMPLPTRQNGATSNGDKIGQEHHYYPLAPKAEQHSVHTGQEHHYVPLAAKSSAQPSSHVSRHHQYVPLTMKHDNVPRLPAEHNYIPLVAQLESSQKVELDHHQYIPAMSHTEKKEAVKLYEHQYVPPPAKQESHVVRKIEGKEHHYVPLVQNYAAKPPQLPREHHYYPLPIGSEVQHQKVTHEQHGYVPAVDRRQQHQPAAQDRQHGYVPYSKKQEEKKEQLHQHQFIPPVKKTEQANGYDRTHHYVPIGQNANHSTVTQTSEKHHFVPQASPRKHVSEKVNEHVQLGGSRKSTIQSEHHSHHHHENHNDVPSRPSSVASSIKHQPHSRTSTMSTARGTPIQRVQPTIQPVVHNLYGDHMSVRVVKNVREFVNVFGATHVVPPPTPLAGVPRLSHTPRSPISNETFQPAVEHSAKSSRKSSVVSIGNGVQVNNGSRKSTVSSVSSASTNSTIQAPILVGGNVIAPRSRQSTLTKDNVHDHANAETELIRVSDMRRLFENFGPAHLPEYASAPYAYIH